MFTVHKLVIYLMVQTLIYRIELLDLHYVINTMKLLFLLLLSSITALSVYTQNSNLTINLNGNRNKNIDIDGKTYTLSANGGAASNKRTITISDLMHGQHTLALVGSNANASRSNSTTITLRTGYDLVVTINPNGGVQTKEVKARNRNTNTAQYNAPMSDANYQVVYQDIKKQWSNSARMAAVADMFSTNTNYFTTSQAAQLIQLINGENNRLSLAKASYRGITDPVNFLQVSSLFNNNTSKNELLVYVDAYNSNNTNSSVYTNNSSSNNKANKTPMSATNYNVLYQQIQNQWQAGAKMTALTSAFVNGNNFFTTAQARKLIQLVDSENSRHALAKSSYRSITDPLNFTQLYDVLSYQTSRDDLTAYVNSYNNSNGNYNNGAATK